MTQTGMSRPVTLNFDIRIGINTGSGFVARVVAQKNSLMTSGADTVNVASRWNPCREPGKINIPRVLYEL